MLATEDEITRIPEVGEKIAQSITIYFQDQDNRSLIAALKKAGLQFSTTTKTKPTADQRLAGKTLVISGSFQDLTREALKTHIKQHGGQLLTAISKNVDYLVAGHRAGPAKLAAAGKMEIPVLSEKEIIKIIGL